MKLKRLELQGFKSFCDRASLQFDHEIVGVVGPNGCGKSNVLDAIRWVMGEQSIKSLRGQSREDVIFNGSEKRKKANFAEVTLTLADVPEEHRPTGYEKCEQIAITRKTIRGGKTLYFLNKQPCRLRDIRMLFLGTGLGKHSYAMIEQGRVNEFIQATPQKRRLLFEEAAGISRYKEHRKMAESRMAQTQANLDRLTDVMKELTSQRNSLQRQARKAKKHRILKGEIRELDLYLASHKHLKLWSKQRQLEILLENLLRKENTLREEMEKQEKATTELQSKLRFESQELQTLREKLQERRARIALLEQSTNHLNKDIGSLEDRRKQIDDETKRLNWQLERDKGELQKLEEQRAMMQEEKVSSQEALEKSNSALEVLSTRLKEIDEHIDSIKREVFEAATAEATHRNQIQENARRLGEVDRRSAENKIELEGAQKQEDFFAAQLQETRTLLERCHNERAFLLDEQEELVEREEELRQKIALMEAKVRREQKKLAEKTAKLESLEEIQAQNQDLNEASRALLLANGAGGPLEDLDMMGIVAEYVDPPREYEVAVAAALGDKLHYIVVKNPEDAQKAITYLHKKGLGRTGFVLMPSSPPPMPMEPPDHPAMMGHLSTFIEATTKDRRLIQQLLQPFLLVTNIEDGFDLWYQVSEEEILVTLDGDLIYPTGEMIGGPAQNASLGMLQRKREIKELLVEVEELEEEVDALVEKHKALQSEHQEVVEKEARHREQIQQLTIKKMALEKDEQRLEADHKRQADRMDLLEKEDTRLAKLKGELEGERDMLNQRVAQLTLQREKQEEQLQEARDQIANDRQAQSELSQQLTDLKVEIATKRERQEALAEQIQQLQRRHVTLNRRLGELETNSDLLVIEMDQKKINREKAGEELVQLQEETEKEQSVLQQQDKDFESNERTLLELCRQLEQKRHTLEQGRNKKTEYLLEQREVQVGMRALDEDIQQRYGIPVGEALPGNHCKPTPTKADREKVKDLKKQLNRLGDVNPLAEQEYAEVDERYQFLTEQITDLEKTLASLKRSIQKINQQSRETFQKTFEIIRGHFSKLFPKLFEGGNANLVLTDPDNMLETGVDIMVRPPGKRRQNIVLLSGGEKAMTTLALIFSFFLYKPSPFCVLDEIDAPLDDANIDRYNRLLRELSSLSQFVVITHNKRTMEMTDHLYGVTMQEPGSSTIVSVKLQEDDLEQFQQEA